MEITITVNGSLIRTSCRGLYNYDKFYFFTVLINSDFFCVKNRITRMWSSTDDQELKGRCLRFLAIRSKFIHSFIPDISIEPLKVHYYSEALPTTALILCRN